MSKPAKRPSLAERLKAGLRECIDHVEGQKTLRTTVVESEDAPRDVAAVAPGETHELIAALTGLQAAAEQLPRTADLTGEKRKAAAQTAASSREAIQRLQSGRLRKAEMMNLMSMVL